MSKLDDNKAALADIVNAPEISTGAEAMAAETPPTKKKPDGVTVDDQAAERNARIFASNLTSAYQGLTGKELANDQIEALSELASMAFAAIKGAAMPKPVYAGLLALIFAIPAIPPMWRLFITTKKKEGANA